MNSFASISVRRPASRASTGGDGLGPCRAADLRLRAAPGALENRLPERSPSSPRSTRPAAQAPPGSGLGSFRGVRTGPISGLRRIWPTCSTARACAFCRRSGGARCRTCATSCSCAGSTSASCRWTPATGSRRRACRSRRCRGCATSRGCTTRRSTSWPAARSATSASSRARRSTSTRPAAAPT